MAVPVEYCSGASKAAAAKQTFRAEANAWLSFSAGTGISALRDGVAISAQCLVMSRRGDRRVGTLL